MKRHPSLAPYSSDHHRILVVAQLLKKSSPAYRGLPTDVQKLKTLIQEPSDGIRIFNFWATWCKPCLEELPYFEAATKNYDPEEVKVYLISLDFKKELDSKLKPFITTNRIQTEVKLLDETDFNSFIDKIDPRWSGAIPATLVLSRTGGKYFYEKQFAEGELQEVINQVIN